MNIIRKTYDQSPHDGFVVPYVLTAILVLSLITVFAMNHLSKAVRVSKLIELAQVESQRIDGTQNKLLYILLTATPMQDGYDLGGGIYGEEKEFGARDLPENYIKDVWVPNGTWRAIDDVYVSLQDEAGLVPINTANEDVLRDLFELAGASSVASRALSAELSDYIDYDFDVRPGGAERIQYRHAKLSEPPNEALRNWVEIKQLRSWSDYQGEIDFEFLQTMTTLKDVQFGISVKYAAIPLAALVEQQQSNRSSGISDALGLNAALESRPSDRVRVTIVSLGEYPFMRQVSIWRSISHVEKPFQTMLVFERSLVGTELADIEAKLLDLGLRNG